MNGDRHNGFGAKSTVFSRGSYKALNSTRRAADRQPPGAAFVTAPATNQWKCPCGGINAASRTSCRYCGEAQTGGGQ
jgi:hypothetical protein